METKILTSVKGYNSDTNSQKMISNTPKLDLVNINAQTKFGQILSISSETRNSDIIKGYNSDTILRNMTDNTPKLDVVKVNAHTKFGRILPISS